jgi:hypothetical protein
MDDPTRMDLYWKRVFGQIRADAIAQAKPNPNMCMGCAIRGLERVLQGLNPLWCEFVAEDQVCFFDESKSKHRQCTNCFLIHEQCYQVSLS